MVRAEPAHVQPRNVIGRASRGDPVCNDLPHTTRTHDSTRVEASCHIVVLNLWHLPDGWAHVMSEALWTIDHLTDLSIADRREPMQDLVHCNLKMIPIFGKELEFKWFGYSILKAEFSFRFKHSSKNATTPLPGIDVPTVIPNDRHGWGNTFHWFCDNVIMF